MLLPRTTLAWGVRAEIFFQVFFEATFYYSWRGSVKTCSKCLKYFNFRGYFTHIKIFHVTVKFFKATFNTYLIHPGD